MSEARLTLMEAVARGRPVTARYNGEIMRLAPHLIYERHGDLFVGALNMDKAWRSPDERRLGHFKLSGLDMVELSDDAFEPLPPSHLAPPREDDSLVMAIALDELVAD
jgi:hypothetical protein